MALPQQFVNAHRYYVKSLYKRYLVNSLNWTISRDIWREKAIEIRAEFERNRNITDPRALAIVLEQAEKRLASELHPDPYKVPTGPDGTKWERNLPPRLDACINHEPEVPKIVPVKAPRPPAKPPVQYPKVPLQELMKDKWANLSHIAQQTRNNRQIFDEDAIGTPYYKEN